MKRLWVRISAVAAVVASLGGGGYYLLTSGSTANEAEGTEVAENQDPSPPTAVVPLADDGGDIAPAFDAAQANLTNESGYPVTRPEPAQANWQDGPSQPIIRQVSSNENEGRYGDAEFRAGDAPPADPSSAYAANPAGAAPGTAAETYGVSDTTPGYGAEAPGYGSALVDAAGAAAGAGAEVESAAIATSAAAAALGAAAAAAAANYDNDGNAPSGYVPAGYGDGAPIAPPPVAQDTSQPVTAPSFATGEAVGSDSPAGGGYGAPPAVVSTPAAGVAAPPSPQFDSQPPPQFTGSPAASAPPPAPVYAAAPAAAQPAGYGQAQAIPAGSAALVAAVPGARTLDGRQTPAVSVEKLAPAEIQVGKPAAFKTLVRNSGNVIAKNVVVTDRLPQGTTLVDVTPQPSQAPDGSLVWQFESLEPGEEVVISLEVMPQVEGEIGSVAQVTFQAQASVRTICTKPQLLVEHSTDPKVLIGEDVVFNITISNPGSGDATNIILEEDVPPGLSHVAGKELEYEVGTLRPGESRRLELVLKASEAGITTNKLRVRGDANLLAEHATQLEVIAPKLLVGMIGPQRRYLERKVKYQVTFANGGTAIAKNVELATYLPKGLQFISTSGQGQYDERDHAVFWSLDQLAPGQEGAIELVAVPVATGEQKLQIEGTADLGLSQKHEHTTMVEAVTEVVFTVSDTQDPIEVGSETTYEIHLANNGSRTGTNVQLMATLPPDLLPLSGEGTSRIAIQGQQVVMEPLERMGPGDEATYRIKVRGERAGDHLIDVRFVCDQVPTPVTKQESTKVYADGL